LHGLQLSVESEKLRPILLRALNKNQILLIIKLKHARAVSRNQFLTELSYNSNVPLSTLKLNFKILKELEIISQNGRLTALGQNINRIIGD